MENTINTGEMTMDFCQCNGSSERNHCESVKTYVASPDISSTYTYINNECNE